MSVRIEQSLRLVLTVDGGERGGQLAEQRHRHQRAVHGRASLARGLQLASENQLVAVDGKPARLQPRSGVRGFEERLDLGAVLSGADQLARGAPAQKEAESVYNYGLSGAGFPGQQRKARPELQLRGRDQSDVLDFQ